MPVPKSFIKSVALEINSEYDLNSSPYTISADDKSMPGKKVPFIGRSQHTAKFLEFLKSAEKKGVFLVTGYRGMGKTSFVNHVLNEYKNCRKRKERKKILPVFLTIAQNNPREIDILRLIVSSVYDSYRDFLSVKNGIKIGKQTWNLWKLLEWFYDILKHLAWVAVLVTIPLILKYVFHSYDLPDFICYYRDWVIYWTGGYCLLVLLTRFIIYFRYANNKAYKRISKLRERCYNTLSEETNENLETTVPLVNLKFLNGEKRVKQYPVAGTKEIEYELQQFLTLASGKHVEFIFTFDELDKVETIITGTDYYDDLEQTDSNSPNSYERKVRDRKQAIINIIAGLKNFFTTANARFIFIAGNEMFDASLADISDRESRISSIFTYVFNIESLLKEKDFLEGMGSVNELSLSAGIELYLKALLFNYDKVKLIATGKEPLYKLAQEEFIYSGLREEQSDKKAKVYFVLQNFVTYLTYRSNGSPKKLIRELHEFIKIDSFHDQQEQMVIARQLLPKGKPTPFIYLVHCQKLNWQICKHITGDIFDILRSRFTRKKQSAIKVTPQRYLYFNYYNQYRIGFINYIYRPYLIKHGRSIKLYSDNLIISTSYLFDHLIKFHPFAFSMTYIELVPEILSSNKTPSLRSHIKKIIEYLSLNHIREIEVGIFDYKFNSRFLNEITFLSKIFEQESAALNYTLDESSLVKIHVINKIKVLRNIYSNIPVDKTTANQIFSIAHLNGVLGDLHFFDQEYNDAIVSYSDAIRPLENIGISKMNMQQFITLNRNRLKIGLCFEKMNSYEDALAHYSNTSMDAIRFMNYRIDTEEFLAIKPNYFQDDAKPFNKLQKGKNIDSGGDNDSKNDNLYHSSSLSDLLQIILQGFLAQLFIQEKKSVAGISAIKLFMAVGSYFKITEGFLAHTTRNHIIKANAFLQAGNLMYFKNTDIHNHMHNDYYQMVPESIVKNINTLNDKFKNMLGETLKKPLLSLYLYILGIFETSAYGEKEGFITDSVKKITFHNNIAWYLLDYFKGQLNKEHSQGYRSIRYNYLAGFLSAIGDNLLAIYKAPKPADKNFKSFAISEIFELSEWKKTSAELISDPSIAVDFTNFLQKSKTDTFNLVDVLTAYHLSASYYIKQGRSSSASFQLSKILYLLRRVLGVETNCLKRASFLSFIDKVIVNKIIDLSGQSTEFTERHMLDKAIDLDIQKKRAVNNISNHPDAREAVLLFNFIKIQIGELYSYRLAPTQWLLSSNNSFATQHGRIMELSFYARYIEKTTLKYTKLCLSEEVKTRNHALEGWLKSRVIKKAVDYLYSQLSILQIIDIYGSDYWLGYSYLAYIHFRVAIYVKVLEEDAELKKNVKDELSKLLGKGSYASLNAIYHFKKARKLYTDTIQLHNGGDAYRSMVDDMIYLEDDFNDSAYHFGAAFDRYLIINGVFESRIKACDKEINSDTLFTSASYL